MARQSRFMLAAALAGAAFVTVDDARAQYVIFAPGTDAAYKQEVLDKVAERKARLAGADRYNVGARWEEGSALGTPITVTWSIVPDGTGPIPKLPDNFFEPAFANTNTFATLDAKFGSRELWLSIIRDAFQVDVAESAIPGTANRWGNVSGLNFIWQRSTMPDPENPGQEITFDWDTGATWDATGSTNGFLTPPGGGGLAPADPESPGVGDIRIGMKQIDNFGGVVAYAYPPDDPMFPGEIVLDSGEEWDRPTVNFRYMRNIVQQMIGFAIGMEVACPEIGERLMEPLQNFAFTGPQVDDIRGVQYLYGDYFEVNDTTDTMAATRIDFEVADSLLGVFKVFDNLSIDIPGDLDVFYLEFPDLGEGDYDFDVLLTATPLGTEYENAPSTDGACFGFEPEEIDARRQRNLRIRLMDTDLMPVDGFECGVIGPPLPTDGSGYFDQAEIGDPECVTFRVTQPGVYYMIIGGAPTDGGDPDQSQLYSLAVSIGNQIFNDGISFDTVALAFAPAGIGANRMTNIAPEQPGVMPGEAVYRGRSQRIGNVEGSHPSLGHTTTKFLDQPEPLISQEYPPQRITWPGAPFAPAATDAVSGHATAAIAVAAGNPVGVFPDGFVGIAPEASWMSASIGIRSFGDGTMFTTSREALAYGLFGLTHPETALSLGLPTTATVLNNSWGSGGDYRGDSAVSQMYDAVVFMTGVPAVVAAGDTGAIDRTPQCDGFAGNGPGSLFRGSRTVTFPAVAFNTISVGAAGKNLPEDTPPTVEFVSPFSQPYTHVIDTSAKGPIDSFNFDTAQTSFNSRPGVDVVSIGSGYILEGMNPLDQTPNPGDPCDYRGHPTVILLSLPALGPNETNPDNPSDPDRFQAGFGTSFAAPAVAGALALMQDYAANQPVPFEIDAKVLRAILLTGARKLDGWSNGPGTTGYPAEPQDNRDGRNPADNDEVVNRETTQALDYAQGAGFADIKRMYEILRGRYDKESLAGFVFGAPSTDVPITDPSIPVINTPPNEQTFIFPIPIDMSGQQQAQGAEGGSVDDLPLSPLEIADLMRQAREGVPENPIFRAMGDFGDPDIGQVGGTKSAAGTNFDARVPFKLPPNPNRPGNPQAEPPAEIPDFLRITVNPIGWDHAQVGQRILNMPAQGTFQGGGIRAGYIDYFVAFAFDGIGDHITATLCWDRAVEMDIPDFSDPDNPLIGEIERLELENLDLELIQTDALGSILDDNVLLGSVGVDDGGVVWASSRSEYSNVEHIHTRNQVQAAEDDDDIPPAGFYTLRVRWLGDENVTGQIYDVFDNSAPGNVEYGLAWRVEPTGSSDPSQDEEGARSSGRAATMPSGQSLRVFTMFLDAFGTSEGDEKFNRAFDVNRDDKVDVQDFGPIARFWFAR